MGTAVYKDWCTSPAPRKKLAIDAEKIANDFPAQPFQMRHHLAGDPLFSLPRLMELAKNLPEDDVEYNAGNIPISIDPAMTPRTGLSIEETIRRIEQCGSWMVLKFVEQDPAYKNLLDECVDEVVSRCDVQWRNTFGRAAFIFLSSPGAITPYHIDPEHNFLLQIQGTKTINVFPASDRTILSEQELEKFYSGAHRNLVFCDRYQGKSMAFELGPGDGVHVPVTAPHWVKNGPAVSISFSITFRSKTSEDREIVYKVNHKLRNLRIAPTPYGENAAFDAVKVRLFRSAAAIGRALARREVPRRKY